MSDVEAAGRLFREFQFEPGTGFYCDLISFPPTAEGVPNLAIRTYRICFDHLPANKRLCITEQLSELIKTIRMLNVNCFMEVWYAPGKPGSKD